MSRTQRGKYSFVVQEFGDGTPWITLQATGEPVEVLEQGVLALHLKPGTDPAEAQRIVDRLNEHVHELSFTSMVGVPHAPPPPSFF